MAAENIYSSDLPYPVSLSVLTTLWKEFWSGSRRGASVENIKLFYKYSLQYQYSLVLWSVVNTNKIVLPDISGSLQSFFAVVV